MPGDGMGWLLSPPWASVSLAVRMELQFPWSSKQSQGLTPWPYPQELPKFEQVGGQPSVSTIW